MADTQYTDKELFQMQAALNAAALAKQQALSNVDAAGKATATQNTDYYKQVAALAMQSLAPALTQGTAAYNQFMSSPLAQQYLTPSQSGSGVQFNTQAYQQQYAQAPAASPASNVFQTSTEAAAAKLAASQPTAAQTADNNYASALKNYYATGDQNAALKAGMVMNNQTGKPYDTLQAAQQASGSAPAAPQSMTDAYQTFAHSPQGAGVSYQQFQQAYSQNPANPGAVLQQQTQQASAAQQAAKQQAITAQQSTAAQQQALAQQNATSPGSMQGIISLAQKNADPYGFMANIQNEMKNRPDAGAEANGILNQLIDPATGAVNNWINSDVVKNTMAAAMNSGTNTVQNAAAARGMLNSGQTLAELQKVGTNAAGQYIVPMAGQLANNVLTQGTSLANNRLSNYYSLLGKGADFVNQQMGNNIGAGVSLANTNANNANSMQQAQMQQQTAISGQQAQLANTQLAAQAQAQQATAQNYQNLGNYAGAQNTYQNDIYGNTQLAGSNIEANRIQQAQQLQMLEDRQNEANKNQKFGAMFNGAGALGGMLMMAAGGGL